MIESSIQMHFRRDVCQDTPDHLLRSPTNVSRRLVQECARMNTHFTLDRESFQNLLARASLAQEYLDSQKATHPGVDLPRKPAIAEQPKEASPVDYIQSLSAIVAVQRAIATDQALHGSGSKSRESHDEHLDKFILHGLPAESNQLSTHARGRPPQERSWWIGSSQKSLLSNRLVSS